MPDPRFESVNHSMPAVRGASGFVLERVESIAGGLSTSDYMSSAAINKKWINFYCRSTAASGDARVAYLRLNLNGAGTGGGEAVRAMTTISAALTTGGAHGIHATLQLDAAGSEAGLSAGARATLAAAAATKTLTGTYAALQVDSDLATGNTVDGQKVSFIRVADNGAVAMPYLFDFSSLTAADTAAAIQADSGAVSTIYGYARVLCPGGAVGYLVIYAAHS